MDQEIEKLLNGLVGKLSDRGQLEQVREQLFKRGVESLLRAEMTAHLGHEKGNPSLTGNVRNGHSQKVLKTPIGEQRIEVPRDREGTFDPVTVPKHGTMAEELHNCILLLYAKGMGNADIVDFVERTYGVQYSTSQVSVITNSLLEEIRQWRQRPLQDVYPIVWMDAIHYKIRHEGKVISKACMVTLGVDLSGEQDILSLDIVETEKAAEWMAILEGLRQRGIRDIFFLCSDNLAGLEKAIEAIYPRSIRQICIVHQVRNSLKYVSYKERKKMAADIKEIYNANDQDSAREALEAFREKWHGKYARAVESWENNWDNLTAFLEYPQEIRKLIYTTNIIESFNASLRKYTRNKKVFPNDDAAIKSIYLAAMAIRKKWKKSRLNWPQIHNQLYIHFKDRMI